MTDTIRSAQEIEAHGKLVGEGTNEGELGKLLVKKRPKTWLTAGDGKDSPG